MTEFPGSSGADAAPVACKQWVNGGDGRARRSLRERLAASVPELDQARLQDRFAGLELTPIADAPGRIPVRVGGEIRSLQVGPSNRLPSMRVSVSDGEGTVVALFTGRRALRGLDPGRGVLLEGVGRWERGQFVLMNPAYTLLP